MAILDGCTNLLAQTCSTVSINTSAVVEYDGPSFACIPLPASPSTLNQVLKAIDDEVCNIKNNIIPALASSSVTNYDGTPTFTCFTLTSGGTLNTIIDEIGTAICANDARLDTFATSDVLTYDGTPSWSCFTLTASPTLNTVINDLGDEICTNQAAIAAKADLTLLQTYTTELRKDYVETGGDTANISGISIDVERTAGGSSVYYVLGVRSVVATETLDSTGGTPARKRLSASSDNYLDFDTDGDYTVTAVPNGNPPPTVQGMRMWKIVTDATTITGTTDLRTIDPIDGADICPLTITDGKMVANTLTSASMSNVVTAGTTNVANVTVDAAGRVTTIASDFDIASPTDLDLIQFQVGTGKWENVTLASLGLTLPTGASGQTLRSNGTNWIANTIIFNDGSQVGINTSSPNSVFTVAGDITPEADGTRNIGASGFRYSTLFMSSIIDYSGNLFFQRATTDVMMIGNGQAAIGTTTPEATAILDLTSTTLGFLPPKMTTTQKNAITTPAEGLIVYDTDLNSPFFFDGGSWVTIFAGSDGDWNITGTDVQLDTTGNALPNTDDANDLGSSTFRWKDLYLGSIIDYNQNLDFKSGGTVRVSFENAGKVGIGTTASVVASALVQMDSTTTGFLPPRLTTAQRDGIASPASGLSIYNSDNNDVEFFDGTSWTGTSSGNNGIYTASGSLSGATTVTQGTNSLFFQTTALTDLLTLADGGIGMGRSTALASTVLAVRGAGATSATNSVLFEDSGGTRAFAVRDDRSIIIGAPAATASTILFDNSTASTEIDFSPISGTNNTATLILGQTGNLSALNTTGAAWQMNKDLRFDTTGSTSAIYVNNGGNGLTLNGRNDTSGGFGITIDDDGNVGVNATTFGTNSVNVFAQGNGTAPTTDIANQYQLYSADIVAGNAAPHFRTEVGDIIKLFKAAALTAVDATAINATYDATEEAVLNNVRTRLNEIEALLQANGLLT